MYMVVFTSSEGRAGYHHADELEDAVKFIERLRNGEGVSDARLYRLTEVPLEVKAYYKVELAGSGGTTPLSVPPPSEIGLNSGSSLGVGN